MSAQIDSELEGLLASAQGRVEARTQAQAIAKVSYSHLAMIDLIIAQPGISQNALAAHFGYTPSWISQVIVSDAFQSALAKRREEVVDPILQASVEEGFKGLVARSLDILHQKLNRPALEIPDNLALRTLEIGARAAGYGAKTDAPVAPSTPAEVHIHLEQLGDGLVKLLQRKKVQAQVIEGEATEVPRVAAAQIAELTNESPQE